MENDLSEQTVSHVTFTFPKRIFEVCYLMKSQAEIEFLGTDANGDYAKEIHLARQDDHISISLDVDNLELDESKLCFYFDKVVAKNESNVQERLEDVTTRLSSNANSNTKSNTSNSNSETEIENDMYNSRTAMVNKSSCSQNKRDKPSLKKRGRPRKELSETETPTIIRKYMESDGDPTTTAASKIDDYTIASSGRKTRKPARFQETKEDIDVKLLRLGEPQLKRAHGRPKKSVSQPKKNLGCRLLWEFLGRLLDDPGYVECIRWENPDDYTFRIVDPSHLSLLWGVQKNRSNMNYEKLSRALRYYYTLGIIEKVQGKLLLYRFKRPLDELRQEQTILKDDQVREAIMEGTTKNKPSESQP